VLEHADARQRADLGPVVTLPRRQQDGYSLAVPGGQFLGDAIGQRPVAADDEVIAVTLRAPGKRRHAAIIVAARMSDTGLSPSGSLTAVTELQLPVARWLAREMNGQAGLLALLRGRAARWGGSTVNEDREQDGREGARIRVAAAAGRVQLALPP
jgi:hypothetical protein